MVKERLARRSYGVVMDSPLSPEHGYLYKDHIYICQYTGEKYVSQGIEWVIRKVTFHLSPERKFVNGCGRLQGEVLSEGENTPRCVNMINLNDKNNKLHSKSTIVCYDGDNPPDFVWKSKGESKPDIPVSRCRYPES